MPQSAERANSRQTQAAGDSGCSASSASWRLETLDTRKLLERQLPDGLLWHFTTTGLSNSQKSEIGKWKNGK